MKKLKFNEYQIINILKQQQAGMPVSDICHEHGISQATFLNWKSKYGEMDVNNLKRMMELEADNARLKMIYV